MKKNEYIILSGNCFWCLEAIFLLLKGVTNVTSGYYNISSYPFAMQHQDKIEAVLIEYDPIILKLSDLLDIHFSIHTPTLNPWDVKTCFSFLHRSSIGYFAEEHLSSIETKIKFINETKKFDKNIETKVFLAKTELFEPAPKDQQKYYIKNPLDGYCDSIITPKIVRLKKDFPKLLIKF